MINIFVRGGGSYKSVFNEEDNYAVVDIPDRADLVCFTGGTDISSSLYGASRNRYTGTPDVGRDQREVDLFRSCRKRGIPMVGICRGAQLLCALSGGSLFQHVANHGSAHLMTTEDGREMTVTSSHHQMMDIRGLKEARLLGSCAPRSPFYLKETNEEEVPPEYDTEVVYFGNTNSLGHQPHPEWMQYDAPYRRYFFETIQSQLEGRL